MDNILKILIILAFLSLQVDAAVSIPPADRHNYHVRAENASSSVTVRMRSSFSLGGNSFFEKIFKNLHIKPPKDIEGAVDQLIKSISKSKSKPKPKPKPKSKPKPKPKPKPKSSGATKITNFKKVLQLLRSEGKQSRRRLSAFDDCLVMTADTIDQIKTSIEIFAGLKFKDGISNLNATQKVQLFNLLSAAQTNAVTCIDGFSHSHADKKSQADILKADWMIFHRTAGYLLSIADSLKVKEAETEIVPPVGDWPEWLSTEEKEILLHLNKGVVLATVSDKAGDFKTVSEAVNDVRMKISGTPSLGKRYVIRIKAGIYKENVVIPKDMKNLTFIGDGAYKTFIIADKNVVDGNTTFNSATVGVAGDGFLASFITFANTAGPSKNQAVALRVNADRAAFYGCNIIGHQNTLYVHSFRQFYKKCTIRGTVDFIFGNAAALFYDCTILARVPNPGQKNTITAQGRDNPIQTTGIVINKSSIGAETGVKGKFTTYLGRPWGKYSRTVVMRTEISDAIDPAGWSEWKGKFALDTLFYAEYKNTGARAGKASRVKWNGIRKLTKEEVQSFTSGNFSSQRVIS